MSHLFDYEQVAPPLWTSEVRKMQASLDGSLAKKEYVLGGPSCFVRGWQETFYLFGNHQKERKQSLVTNRGSLWGQRRHSF